MQVRKNQLRVDRLHVGLRVDLTIDMDHIGVGENPHHLSNGISFPNVGEELVSQALTLARALHDPGDINKGHRGGEDALTTENLSEGV